MFGPFGAYLASYLHGYVNAFLMFALSTVALVSDLTFRANTLKKVLMKIFN